MGPRFRRPFNSFRARSVGILCAMVCFCAFERTASAEPDRLRVLTLNAFIAPLISPNLEGRKNLLGRKIGDLAPDIVTLQEVWNEEDARDVARALASEGLPHARWVARPGRPPFGSSGLMTVSRYPLTVVEFDPYDAGATPPVLFHVDWTASKGVLTTRATTPFGPLDVANTHVHAGYPLYDYPVVRLMQLVELTEVVERHEPEEPLIVAGDLNSQPASLPVRFLRATGALSIVSEALDIDLILSRDSRRVRLVPIETRTVLTEPLELEDGTVDVLSDHPGVLTVFEVQTGSGNGASPRGPSARRSLLEEAKRTIEGRIVLTRRLRWLAILLSLLGATVLALVVRQRAKGRIGPFYWIARWAGMALLGTVVVWSGYLGTLYATHHLRDLDRSLERLALLERARR